jgi:tetratricopeptide (TPR) repeat protein
VCLLLLVRAAGAAPPPGAAEAFLEGNRYYADNDFAGAAAAYETVLALGVTAPALEYNLGNACLKSGRRGDAVLHYRRALKLDPAFESARTNLDYARASAQDVVPETSEGTRFDWVGRVRLGPEAAARSVFLAATAFFLVAGLRLLGWRGRTGAAVLQGVLGAAVLLLAAALLFEWTELTGKHEGVVTVSEVDVRSGPAETYTVSFKLHEGTEVEIVRKRSGWQEVKVSDRLQGWVPEEVLAGI